jgi:hypothetical protein
VEAKLGREELMSKIISEMKKFPETSFFFTVCPQTHPPRSPKVKNISNSIFSNTFEDTGS